VCRKPIKLSLVALLVGAGIMSTTAVLVVGGQSAVAASKGVICPDNATGVTEGSWGIACTDQTVAGASISIKKTTSKQVSLDIKAASSKVTFGDVTGSLMASGDALFTIDAENNGTVIAAIQIVVKNATRAPSKTTFERIVDPNSGQTTAVALIVVN
jgi:hypothetical protein